jgi:hypothetical protein
VGLRLPLPGAVMYWRDFWQHCCAVMNLLPQHLLQCGSMAGQLLMPLTAEEQLPETCRDC